jgi:hypothetical protein
LDCSATEEEEEEEEEGLSDKYRLTLPDGSVSGTQPTAQTRCGLPTRSDKQYV